MKNISKFERNFSSFLCISSFFMSSLEWKSVVEAFARISHRFLVSTSTAEDFYLLAWLALALLGRSATFSGQLPRAKSSLSTPQNDHLEPHSYIAFSAKKLIGEKVIWRNWMENHHWENPDRISWYEERKILL